MSLWAKKPITPHPAQPTPKVPVAAPTPPTEPLPVQGPHNDPLSVYAPQEAWPRRFGGPRPSPEELPSRSEDRGGRPRIEKLKRRRSVISVAVSEEEEALIREAAAKRNSSISDFMRVAAFRALGRRCPPRDEK